MGTNSISNGPSVRREPCATIVDRHFRRARFGEAAGPQQAGGKARRIDRAAETRPQRRDGADMVLMRMGDDEAEQILAILLDEGGSGRIRSTPGMSGPAKATPQSTMIYLRFFSVRNHRARRSCRFRQDRRAGRRRFLRSQQPLLLFFLEIFHAHRAGPRVTSPASMISVAPSGLSNSIRPCASMPRKRPSRVAPPRTTRTGPSMPPAFSSQAARIAAKLSPRAQRSSASTSVVRQRREKRRRGRRLRADAFEAGCRIRRVGRRWSCSSRRNR